jgi:cytochrome c-type biogenesis protein CcmF
MDRHATLAAIAFGFGVWLILGSILEFADRTRLGRAPWAETRRRLATLPRASIGMTISHAALGFVVLGAVATSAWNVELIRTFRIGDSAPFAGWQATLTNVEQVRGPNYDAERATITLTQDGNPYVVLTPERRMFRVQQRETAETSIRTNFLRDVYATLGEGDALKGWTIRLYDNPLAPWIWLGAALCALGGFVSLSDRRLRIGAPKRSRIVAQPAE